MTGIPDDATPQHSIDPIRENAIRIVDFLRDFTQLKSSVQYHIDKYDAHLWFNDVPQEKGCYVKGRPNAQEAPAETWLEMAKQPEPKMPPVPADLEEWVERKTLENTGGLPTMRSEVVRLAEPDPDSAELLEPERIQLQDHPEIEAAWQEWVSKRWEPWSQLHKAWEARHKVYGDLFSMHQALVRGGESLELVVGLCLLTWKPPTGTHEIRRHLVTTKAVLVFEAERGVIRIEAPADGVKLQTEFEMLEASDRPSTKDDEQIQRAMAEASEDIWDRTRIDLVGAAIANSLRDSDSFSSSIQPERSAGARARVTFAPALILRKRSTKGCLAMLAEIRRQLLDGAELPPFMSLMAGRTASEQGEGGQRTASDEPTEIHFPLPANEEQLEIVRRLRGRAGIHVQGPPGTGKSHTIANLICHLLASGKRVLITAQTSHALKVLRDKLPKEVQALCVSIVGDDKRAMQELEKCGLDIVNRHHTFRGAEYEGRIKAARERLAELQERERKVKLTLRSLRERETLQHTIADGAYHGTAASIAAKLAEEQEHLPQLEDEVDAATPPPLTNAEALELLALLRNLAAADPLDVSCAAPTSEQLKRWNAGLRLPFAEEQDAIQATSESQPHANGALAALASRLPDAAFDQLRQAVKTYEQRLGELPSTALPWVGKAVVDVCAKQGSSWSDLHERCAKAIAGLLQAAKRRDSVRLAIPQGMDPVRIRAQAQDLKAYLLGGGSLGWFASLLNPIVNQTTAMRQQVSVDGRPPETVVVLDTLMDCLGTERQLEDMTKLWAGHASVPAGEATARATFLAQQVRTLEQVLALTPLVAACAEAAGRANLPSQTWSALTEVRSLLFALEHSHRLRMANRARAAIESVIVPLREFAHRPDAHPVVAQIHDACQQRNLALAASFLDATSRIEKVATWRQRSEQLGSKLRRGAPHLHEALVAGFAEEQWDTRLGQLEQSWQHARAVDWLDSTFGMATEQDCETELSELADSISEERAKLAADLAWMHCLGRMREHHRRHFTGWMKAVKMLGKGTGKNAETHRRDAQGHLTECRDAIPAWIMPLYNVFDSVTPVAGAFDVVIVDEASQCGLDSRVLTYLARQIIVVGDDKQISPILVGVNQQDVFDLMARHLETVPHQDSFKAEYSLFDFAELWLGSCVALREHFRCVPEIIRFSSDLSYSNKPLIPLRQYPPDRLKPLVVRKVNGIREGGTAARNREEAEAIVKAMRRCDADPRYNGLTFGVISLQGDPQAKLIERLMSKEMLPKSIDQRKIICGDAYSFQGDERNVMFLSMVAAPNERFAALTKEMFQRSFNVAASRARDQMWLFHSVDASEMNPECMRRRLLAHFYDPHSQHLTNLPVEELRERAKARNRALGNQPRPFDSWFEVDVFLKIVEQGYRVVPQFPMAGARIDLMVEGLRARLAVECHGEHWHGPENWELDQARQRRLERAGLEFFTVWESAFRRDPDETLAPLWHRLRQMGFEPFSRTANGAVDLDGYVPPEDAPLSESDSGTSNSPPRQDAVPPTRAAGDGVRAGSRGSSSESSVDGEDESVSVDSPAPQNPPTVTGQRPSKVGLGDGLSEGAQDAAEGDEEDEEAEVDDEVDGQVDDDDDLVIGKPRRAGDDQTSLFGVEAGSTYTLSGMAEYVVWDARKLPDPRVAHIKELVKGLEAIIEVEGPVLCLRAYELFARASGLQRIHSGTRSRFNQAIQRGVQEGRFVVSDGYGTQYQMNRFVRLKGTPETRLRTNGPRTLDEIPPAELAARMRAIVEHEKPDDREELFQRLLESLGFTRLSTQARSKFEEAFKRSQPPIRLG
jgi:very-short-patch-repair endonuclease